MAKAEKASEPTMDEILASIRKIIAEDPVGKQVGSTSTSTADAGGDPKFPAPRASLDDILGLADVPTAVSSPASSGKSDAANKPDTASKVEAAKKADALPSSPIAAKPAEPVKPLTDSARPFFPSPAGGKPADDIATDRAVAGPEARTEPSRPVDFGTIVPSKPAPQSAGADDHDRRPIAGRLPEWLSRGGGAAPAPSRTAPKPAAEAKRGAPGTPFEPSAPAKPTTDFAPKPLGADFPAPPKASSATPSLFDPPSNVIGAAGAKPASPTVNSPASSGNAPADAKGAAPGDKGAGTAPASGSAGPATQSKPGASPAASVPASTSGNQSKAPATQTGSGSGEPFNFGLGGAPAANGFGAGSGVMPTARPSASIPVVTEKPMTVPVPVAESEAPIARPAMLDKSKAIKPATASDLVASASPLAGVRTLDDTIIDLLRPMIRQWLDDNMPRMVEKALRIEMAASLQAKGAPGKGESSKH